MINVCVCMCVRECMRVLIMQACWSHWMIDDSGVMDRAHAGSHRGENRTRPWQHHATSVGPSCVYNRHSASNTQRRSFIYSQQFVGSLSCGKILVKPALHPLQCEKCEATKNKKPFMLWTYWSCSTSDQYKSGFRLWSIHVMSALTWCLIDLYWKFISPTPAPQRSGPRERSDTVGMRCDFCIVSVFIYLVYCRSASQMNAAQWITHWRRHIMCDIFLFLQCLIKVLVHANMQTCKRACACISTQCLLEAVFAPSCWH